MGWADTLQKVGLLFGGSGSESEVTSVNPLPVELSLNANDVPVITDDVKLPPANMLFSLLKVDGTGSVEMNIDGSMASVSFRYVVPVAKSVSLQRVLFEIADAGIRPNRFAGIGALANGLTIKLHDVDDAELLDFLDGTTIQQNTNFTILAGVDSTILDGTGDDHLPIRWTIANAGHAIELTAGQYLEIIVADDLSDLSLFRMMVQGEIFDI